MKRTASQAVIASRKQIRRLNSLVGRYPVWGVSAVVVVFLMSFFLGRESASQTSDLHHEIADLRLEMLLQQRDVDRLLHDNYSNINALAVRMAELQAASTRIDALGERLAQMGQLTLDEFDFNQTAALGGPSDPGLLVEESEDEFRLSIEMLSEKLRRQGSQLDALQFLMANRELESGMTPAGWPVRKGWISSRYGERNDPFTGQRVRHTGLDFAGVRGSDVLSVANGVVVWAGNRSGYGKTIEVDHGNGYQTRYAHNESLEVVPGTHVTAGQMIAKMGSTGRASSPHVHFEVLHEGAKVNPAKFVEQLR